MNGAPFTPRDATWLWIWFTLLSALALDGYMWYTYGQSSTITRVLIDRSSTNPIPLIALWIFFGHMIYSAYRH